MASEANSPLKPSTATLNVTKYRLSNMAETNDHHKVIALFDVDGTLTVPRKVHSYYVE